MSGVCRSGSSRKRTTKRHLLDDSSEDFVDDFLDTEPIFRLPKNLCAEKSTGTSRLRGRSKKDTKKTVSQEKKNITKRSLREKSINTLPEGESLSQETKIASKNESALGEAKLNTSQARKISKMKRSVSQDASQTKLSVIPVVDILDDNDHEEVTKLANQALQDSKQVLKMQGESQKESEEGNNKNEERQDSNQEEEEDDGVSAEIEDDNEEDSNLLNEIEKSLCSDDKLCPCCKVIVPSALYTDHFKNCLQQFKLTRNGNTRQEDTDNRCQGKRYNRKRNLGDNNEQEEGGNLTSVIPCPIMKNKTRKQGNKKDPDMQMALALSRSIAEREVEDRAENEARLLELGLDHIVDEDRRKVPVLLPSNLAEPSKAKKSQSRNRKLKENSVLAQRTTEERERLISEKVAMLLACEEQVPSVWDHKGASQVKSRLVHYQDETCSVWNASHSTDQRPLQDFYVSELQPYIEPQNIEIGGLLKRLSQIPGRLNITSTVHDTEEESGESECDEEDGVVDAYCTQLALAGLLGSQNSFNMTRGVEDFQLKLSENESEEMDINKSSKEILETNKSFNPYFKQILDTNKSINIDSNQLVDLNKFSILESDSAIDSNTKVHMGEGFLSVSLPDTKEETIQTQQTFENITFPEQFKEKTESHKHNREETISHKQTDNDIESPKQINEEKSHMETKSEGESVEIISLNSDMIESQNIDMRKSKNISETRSNDLDSYNESESNSMGFCASEELTLCYSSGDSDDVIIKEKMEIDIWDEKIQKTGEGGYGEDRMKEDEEIRGKEEKRDARAKEDEGDSREKNEERKESDKVKGMEKREQSSNSDNMITEDKVWGLCLSDSNDTLVFSELEQEFDSPINTGRIDFTSFKSGESIEKNKKSSEIENISLSDSNETKVFSELESDFDSPIKSKSPNKLKYKSDTEIKLVKKNREQILNKSPQYRGGKNGKDEEEGEEGEDKEKNNEKDIGEKTEKGERVEEKEYEEEKGREKEKKKIENKKAEHTDDHESILSIAWDNIPEDNSQTPRRRFLLHRPSPHESLVAIECRRTQSRLIYGQAGNDINDVSIEHDVTNSLDHWTSPDAASDTSPRVSDKDGEGREKRKDEEKGNEKGVHNQLQEERENREKVEKVGERGKKGDDGENRKKRVKETEEEVREDGEKEEGEEKGLHNMPSMLNQLSEAWEDIFKTGINADISISTSDGQTLCAHSLVLLARCPILYSEILDAKTTLINLNTGNSNKVLNNSNISELSLSNKSLVDSKISLNWNEVSFKVAQVFLRYLYIGKCEIGIKDEPLKIGILNLALKYKCNELVDLLESLRKTTTTFNHFGRTDSNGSMDIGTKSIANTVQGQIVKINKSEDKSTKTVRSTQPCQSTKIVTNIAQGQISDIVQCQNTKTELSKGIKTNKNTVQNQIEETDLNRMQSHTERSNLNISLEIISNAIENQNHKEQSDYFTSPKIVSGLKRNEHYPSVYKSPDLFETSVSDKSSCNFISIQEKNDTSFTSVADERNSLISIPECNKHFIFSPEEDKNVMLTPEKRQKLNVESADSKENSRQFKSKEKAVIEFNEDVSGVSKQKLTIESIDSNKKQEVKVCKNMGKLKQSGSTVETEGDLIDLTLSDSEASECVMDEVGKDKESMTSNSVGNDKEPVTSRTIPKSSEEKEESEDDKSEGHMSSVWDDFDDGMCFDAVPIDCIYKQNKTVYIGEKDGKKLDELPCLQKPDTGSKLRDVMEVESHHRSFENSRTMHITPTSLEHKSTLELSPLTPRTQLSFSPNTTKNVHSTPFVQYEQDHSGNRTNSIRKNMTSTPYERDLSSSNSLRREGPGDNTLAEAAAEMESSAVLKAFEIEEAMSTEGDRSKNTTTTTTTTTTTKLGGSDEIGRLDDDKRNINDVVTPQGKRSRASISVTPMPDYKMMTSPQLKKELQRYGVREIGRRKAVVLLQHFYDQTHPLVTDSEADTTFTETPTIKRSQTTTESTRRGKSILVRNSSATEDRKRKRKLTDVVPSKVGRKTEEKDAGGIGKRGRTEGGKEGERRRVKGRGEEERKEGSKGAEIEEGIEDRASKVGKKEEEIRMSEEVGEEEKERKRKRGRKGSWKRRGKEREKDVKIDIGDENNREEITQSMSRGSDKKLSEESNTKLKLEDSSRTLLSTEKSKGKSQSSEESSGKSQSAEDNRGRSQKTSFATTAELQNEDDDDDDEDQLNSSQTSTTSTDSSVLECFEESYAAHVEDDCITTTQQVNLANQVKEYITSDPELHRKVLLYQPFFIDELQSALKTNGVKCKMNSLMDILDEECITFRSQAGQKNRQRTKRSPKKRKLKSSSKIGVKKT